jgi:hypothetical protein
MSKNSINVQVNPKARISTSVKPKQSVLVNQSGVIAVRRLSDLLDVDVTDKVDGSLLIYNEQQQKFITASVILDEIDGGFY